MDVTHSTTDPLWPRAAHWIAPADSESAGPCDLALIGVPASRRSLTPTRADTTPAAIRETLSRYSTWAGSHDLDVGELRAVDFGDADDPDGYGGDERIAAAAVHAGGCRLLVALGGDNSITFPLMTGLAGDSLADWGLITIDAHHDLRDGEGNGSPVRRLTEAGLPGANIVQIGIADFSNSPRYAQRARDLGITVIPRSGLRSRTLGEIALTALETAGAGGRSVFVDVDVDVCDRAAVPGCPSSAPGGISADELRQLVFLLARDPRVRALDVTEVDAGSDAPDGRTVRLAALVVLEAAAGLASREA